MTESQSEIETTRDAWIRDKALWALLVLAGALSPFGFNLTATLSLQVYPLHLIIAVYLGYRMGRWYGAAAGFAMVAPWLYVPPPDAVDWLEDIDIFGDLYLSAMNVGVDEVLVAIVFGWVAGYVSDFAESILVRNKVFLATFLPRRRTSWIALSARRLPKLFQNWSGNKEAPDAEEKPRFTLDSLVVNVRGIGTRINQLAIIPSVLITLNVYIVFVIVEADAGELELSLIPYGLSAVLLILIGYITASWISVFIAFLVWSGSLITLVAEYGLAAAAYDADASVSLPIEGFGSIVGVTVLTWIAVRTRRIQRSGELEDTLAGMVEPFRRRTYEPPAATLTVLMPLILLFVVVDLPFDTDAWFETQANSEVASPASESGEDDFEEIIVLDASYDGRIVLQPWTLIFCALVYLGSVFDARGISNRFIAFFGVLLFFRFYFDWGESVWVSTYMPGAGEFVLLALAPFLGRYLDLGQLGVCRTVLACGWLLSALFKVYVHGSIDAGVLAISQSTFASLIIQAGLIELLARLLCKSENSAGFRSLIGGRRGTAETA